MMNTIAEPLQPGIISPRAVPAAGGCSVSVITMMRILSPTEIAATRSVIYRDSSAALSTPGIFRIADRPEPTTTATR